MTAPYPFHLTRLLFHLSLAIYLMHETLAPEGSGAGTQA
jgi:hypothetical protein